MLNKTLVAALLCALPTTLRGEALFQGPVAAGIYGAPHISFSNLNGDFALFVGGEGALVANHQWVIGGGGSWLVTDHKVSAPPPDSVRRIRLGYGGLKLGYIATPSYLIHLTFGALIGAGGVRFADPDRDNNGHGMNRGDAFFIFEPEAGAELNITENVRLNIAATYRWITATDTRFGVSAADLSGPALALALRFGLLSHDGSSHAGHFGHCW